MVPLFGAGLALACSDGSAPAPQTQPDAGNGQQTEAPQPDPVETLAARGERVYRANCIACHNPDPTKGGGLGPDVAGSSRELLEARIVHGTYPEGYTPKSDTRAMIPLPHLAPELDALAAYLQADSS